MNNEAQRKEFRMTRPAEGIGGMLANDRECDQVGKASEISQEAYQEAMRRRRSELLDELFSYHSPTPEQLPRYRAIRSAARHFAEIILDNAPVCGDQSRAVDAVRMAMMLANAAIATNGRS